ncbi:MAG: hypothetical protein ACI9UN_001306 [Granulosicoccus sp.]|jgi:hypothetical protein
MKNILTKALLSLVLISTANARDFSATVSVVTQMPEYTLIDCSYGQYGNEYGNIGTYQSGNGSTSTRFYDEDPCED